MKISAVVIICIWLITGTALTQAVLGQTPTPTPVPKLAALSREVREEVDRLASNEAGKRATGAASLGQMGAAATPAIPYLAALVSDGTEVYGLEGRKTVGVIAGMALCEIGPKGTEVLIGQLKREGNAERMARTNAARALGQKKVAVAAPALRAALAHSAPNWFDAQAIVEALAALNDSGSLVSIMAFLEQHSDTDFSWGNYMEPLKDLTGQLFRYKKDALTWWQENKGRFKEQK